MTTHVVTARRTDNHAEVRVNREPLPPMPHSDAMELLAMLRRSMPWLNRRGCNVELAIETVRSIR